MNATGHLPGEPGAAVPRVVLGVAGGIAAYKSCEVVRRLRDHGVVVDVVPTPSSLNFVGLATWQALSGRPVATDVWSDITEVPHVRLGQQADLVVVAPATADLLARAAQGRADDLLTNVLLTARCPVVMFPAMHTEMWQHAATTANVATLRSRGVVVKDPASGRLTGADIGAGRLPEPAEVVDIVLQLLEGGADAARKAAEHDLSGRRVVISAGGTREYLDPVRFLGNSSAGLMGVALAREAALRGAEVTLVAAHVETELPSGVVIERVSSTTDLRDAMVGLARDADVVIMAAAPADFTPAQASDTKIKKNGDGGLDLDLVQTPDVLAGLAASKPDGQVLVGFAAETAPDREELIGLGRTKLAHKGCDLLVLNDVSGGKVFGLATTSVVVLGADGPLSAVTGSKSAAAAAIIDAAAQRLVPRTPRQG